jgi:ABC-type multidrug transport system ATPase subunit
MTVRIEPEEIVGFLGPNGAGKSTTAKILSPSMTRAGLGGSSLDQTRSAVMAKTAPGRNFHESA